MLEHNFFFRYPRVGTVLHWRDTEMKNLLLTLPYSGAQYYVSLGACPRTEWGGWIHFWDR